MNSVSYIYFLKNYMHFFHNIIKFLFLFVALFYFFAINQAFASNHLTYINSGSSTTTVKKLQNVFSWLWLYDWKIDWKYNSIKDEIVDYQIKNNIVSSKKSSEAWYFWKKTIKSLEKNYWKKFLNLQKKYLTPEKIEKYKKWTFTVTAYYTPVRWQYKYQRWSYRADVRLNGRWITSSWKKPFAWVLALPRNYKFGTKIYLDWLWVWVVEDRGWAIVNSWEKWQLHDRIDIWVGYGDEGRERAIKWWRRKVEWYLVDEKEEITIEFDKSKIAKYSWLKIDAENPKKENVIKLQDLFKEIWLYKWKINWIYEDIKDELVAYQKSKWIRKHLWYFWNKTYNFLKKDYWVKNWLFIEKHRNKEEDKEEKLTLNEKNNIKIVKDKLIEIFKKQNKSKEKLDLTISSFKVKLTEMIPKMRKEKQKLVLKYLIEIL